MSEYLSTLHADRLIDMHGSILRGFLFFYLLRCGPLFCLAPMSGRLTDTLVIVSPFSLSLSLFWGPFLLFHLELYI
jgi:hypothetical protein